jgi:5-methylcytosine-specific restriction endonuclease McrA
MKRIPSKPNRYTKKYLDWRASVLKENLYTCRVCGMSIYNTNIKNLKLQAHHIKPYAKYPELRYEVLNGEVLCSKCHINTHKKNGGDKNEPNTEKFSRRVTQKNKGNGSTTGNGSLQINNKFVGKKHKWTKKDRELTTILLTEADLFINLLENF